MGGQGYYGEDAMREWETTGECGVASPGDGCNESERRRGPI